MDSNIPSLFEELNRKTVDALTWLEEGRASGELTPDQIYVAQQALFMAVAGLVNNDVGDLMSASSVDTSKTRGQQTVLARGSNLAIIRLDSDGVVNVDGLAFNPTNVVRKHFQSDDFLSGRRRYKNVVAELSKKGYTSIGERR